MKGLFFAREHNTVTRLGYGPEPLNLGPTHHRAECLNINGYSWALKREIWMRSRLGKPTIREERAESGAAAWIKLARPIARSNH